MTIVEIKNLPEAMGIATGDVGVAALRAAVSEEVEASMTDEVEEASMTDEVEEASMTDEVEEASMTDEVEEASMTDEAEEASMTDEAEEASMTDEVEEALMTDEVEEDTIVVAEDMVGMTMTEIEMVEVLTEEAVTTTIEVVSIIPIEEVAAEADTTITMIAAAADLIHSKGVVTIEGQQQRAKVPVVPDLDCNSRQERLRCQSAQNQNLRNQKKRWKLLLSVKKARKLKMK
jgi:hypothetical protein